MKTLHSKIIDTIRRYIVLSIAVICTVHTGNSTYANSKQDDTASFVSISGKIIDTETKKSIMYANAFIVGTNIGTVSNANGEFLLKIPKQKVGEKVGFSHLGYKNYVIAISSLKKTDNNIALEPELVSLQEIIVRIEDPISLLKGAVANINKNYSKKATSVTGFYREAIQQNRRYVSIAEAVLDAYKAPYNNFFQDDKVKIVIGRKSQDVKKMDTVVVKLQGGPVTPFFLDLAKNPENLISEDNFKYYDYKLTGQVSLDNSRCYVIEFEQRKDAADQALYKGKIYIDVETLAIVAAEYSLSEIGLPIANSMFVKKKPLTMRIDITGADYYIKYAKTNDIWNLSYVRSELRFKCKWKKRFFSSSYVTMSEMAVTDIDIENVSKYKSNETTKMTDIFSDKADNFKNDEFWGDYNIIVPEESIQSAIEKINKRLKKR